MKTAHYSMRRKFFFFSNDIRAAVPTVECRMNAPSILAIAKAYGISRQAMWQLMHRHDLKLSQVLKPQILWNYLRENGNSCLLRTMLANPENRRTIELEIANLRPNRIHSYSNIQ